MKENKNLISNIDEYSSDWTGEQKTAFRATKPWKDFRKTFTESKKYTCELCGTRYTASKMKYLHVHHLDPANYTDLNPDKFAALCSQCHSLVERIEVKLKAKKQTILNKEKWINLLGDFITFGVKEKLE